LTGWKADPAPVKDQSQTGQRPIPNRSKTGPGPVSGWILSKHRHRCRRVHTLARGGRRAHVPPLGPDSCRCVGIGRRA